MTKIMEDKLNKLINQKKQIQKNITNHCNDFVKQNFNIKYIDEYYQNKSNQFKIIYSEYYTTLTFSLNKDNSLNIETTILKNTLDFNEINHFHEINSSFISDLNIISQKNENIKDLLIKINQFNINDNEIKKQIDNEITNNIKINNEKLFKKFENVLTPYSGSLDDFIQKLHKDAKGYSCDGFGEDFFEIEFLTLKKINQHVYFSMNEILIYNFGQKNEIYQLGRLKNVNLLTKKQLLEVLTTAFYFENEIVTSSDKFNGIKREKGIMGMPILEDNFLKYFSKHLNKQKIVEF